MKKNRKLIFEILLFVVLVVATVLFVFKDINLDKTFDIISNSNPCYIMCAIVCIMLFLFFDGYTIKLLFANMGQKMSFFKYMKYAFVEFLFSGLTPSSTGGQPMQIISMADDGYKKTDSTVALVAIAFLYRLTLIIFMGLAFVFDFRFVMGYVKSVPHTFILGIVLNTAFAALLFMFLFSKKVIVFLLHLGVGFLAAVSKKVRNNKKQYIEKSDAFMAKYHACSSFMFSHIGTVIKAFIVLSAQRLSLLAVTYFVYKAIGLGGMTFLNVICIQLILSICVDILPFPGSVGINETIFLRLYKTAFGLSVFPVVILSRSISFYIPFVLSAIVVFLVRLYKLFKRQ